MLDPERLGQLVDADDGGVAPALFQAADVLLAEAGLLGELLLGQPLPLPELPYIPPDQLAHVHAPRSAGYILGFYQL